MRFRHAYNFELNDSSMTSNDEPSMTIPDESYTVQELFRRFAAGIAPPVSQNPHFELDENSDDFDSYDPIEDPSFDMVDAVAEIETVNVKKKSLPFQSQELPFTPKDNEGTEADEGVK